jgi:hypothetical protein
MAGTGYTRPALLLDKLDGPCLAFPEISSITTPSRKAGDISRRSDHVFDIDASGQSGRFATYVREEASLRQSE